jgi:hypothetical protein
VIALILALALLQPARADRGRFTAIYFPQDERLANSMLEWAAAGDSFPGLPLPRRRVVIAIAPDHERFREWVGQSAPEWGAAVAFPWQQRIVMQGQRSGSDAGDPREVLRHELAHLALYEAMGDLPPTWFDEGYASFAAHEWRREDALSANLALAFGGMRSLRQLDRDFAGGSAAARDAYALAYRAVADLSVLGGEQGLSPFFANWRREESFERAIRLTFGLTSTQFEKGWQSRLRRRYGAIALVQNIAVAGGLLGFLLVPFYLARRRRQRRRLADMVAADAALERAREESPLDIFLTPGFELPKADPTTDPERSVTDP